MISTLAAAIALCPTAAAAVNSRGVIWLCNEPFAALLGHSRSEIEGQVCLSELALLGEQAAAHKQHQALMAGSVESYELDGHCCRPDGQSFWMHLVVGCFDHSYSLVFAHSITRHQEVSALEVLKDELLEAIRLRQFVLWYQPIVHLATGRILAQEALVRWQHPNGLRYPNYFLPFARHLGLETWICRIVLGLAAKQLRAWSDTGETWAVAVNIEPSTLELVAFEEMVEFAIARYGAPADRLWLEIVETQSLDIESLVDKLRRLSKRHLLAIDDFGAGYSNLGAVTRYPVQALKIDKHLIKGVDHDPGLQTVVGTVIVMAHELGLKVVAEGIETEAELQWLKTYGCDFGQGFWLGRPAAAKQ
ncbi:EAL domain-containing protein [Pseudanabaena sp. FACHB-2040]|uniref:sensor domain-containing phosphodiesterase n=1 Tax=Pseudanabaena sp. FACHB-2040 TaxID=2692859 RepID=UPI0016834349|nr:EAL domain-containing protein [Pseudanabaena sp. FACHB-2040]MBD2261389.1 EAL domain-containing protein [Pseudanabaena sp. FACHB-2040]